MFEDAEKADKIIEKIADLGRYAAEQVVSKGEARAEGWTKLGEMLRELAQASPAACIQLAQAWEQMIQKGEGSDRFIVAEEAAGQAYLAADYAQYEADILRTMSSFRSTPRAREKSFWMADCKAVCFITQEYDDEGEMQDSTSIDFVDNFDGIREERAQLMVDALEQLTRDGLDSSHGCGWSAEEIYDEAHDSWGVGAWRDTTKLAQAAEVAKVVFEERVLSRQTPQAAKTKTARI